MMESLAGIVIAAALMALVLEPLIRGRPRAIPAEEAAGEFDFTDVEESESPKIQALLAIKEIEFDRETGKLSDDDYIALKTNYQRAALAAIKTEKQEGLTSQAETTQAICPTCGPRPETSAMFCSDCGQPLSSANMPTRCTNCGGAVPSGAKFCGECGTAINRP